ncbi:MAG: adenosine deaminase [Lactobacillus sp.]|uniref:adenosine deaminase n=1 Tax=Bombilactobacillus bombi TaxID=1303590 RepID=UPI0035ED3847|nr:adenosine deaminase [Lactobacillus sp.]
MNNLDTRTFIKYLPKAELHLHIEGTLEPELQLKLAKRNHIQLKQSTVEEIKQTYHYHDLPSFLEVYYSALSVLQTEQDFYDLAFSYLTKAAQNNIRHAEIFFDPQAHTSRGIPFKTIVNGLYRAIVDARALNIDAGLIMCFLRDYSKESARKTLKEAINSKDKILGVGLDSDEHNNPPLKFVRQFEDAAAVGFHLTTHCDLDQKNSIEHIRQALELMDVERLDHGTNIVEDPDLVQLAAHRKIGITSCPHSNSLGNPVMKGKEVIELLNKGVKVSINSDDPAYFGGYINDSYNAIAQKFHLTKAQIIQLAKNSFETSWISQQAKTLYLKEIEEYISNNDIIEDDK